MDGHSTELAEEIRRSQRCISDLISILSLPAMWTGGEPSRIVETLVDALVDMLQLDCVYVRLKDADGKSPTEALRVSRSRAQIASPHEIDNLLNECLNAEPQQRPLLLRNAMEDRDILLVPLRLGLQGEIGVIVTGAARADFPQQTERVILSVATNQASIALQEARFRSEQKRIANELDRRVAQRTIELAAANEELQKEIADRKHAEDKLRSSERDLSLIIETIPGLVWCATPEGELSYLNRRMLDYTGTDYETWEKLGWSSFLHPDDVDSTLRTWSRAVASGEPYDTQCRLCGANGVYRWFHALGQAARDVEGKVSRWYGLLIDIDEQKKVEQALRNSEMRLSRATRTATVGEFAASIAHEINQPLAAVVANGHACLRWLSSGPEGLIRAREAAQRIIRDGKEAGEVVRRIRSLFNNTSIERMDLELNDMIAEVLHLLSAEASKRRITVETDLADDLPPVIGDRVQLQQLTFNLLLNGIEAMDASLNHPKKLSIRSRQQDPETILVEIRDSGVGIEDSEKVFEAFFTTKENGMGMGLAVCRSIIHAHQGRLWAASRKGEGTTFSFTLPVQPSAAS